MKIKKIIIIFLFQLLVLFNLSFAGEPQAIFGDWYFFKYVNKENKLLCYIMSIPKSRYDNFEKRGESFFTVIQEKDEPFQEIYLSFGQNYKKKIEAATIEIVKYKFPIFTVKDKGWTYNRMDDFEAISKIKRSLFFSVLVSYEDNKNLLDIYSASGFAEAIEHLSKNCY